MLRSVKYGLYGAVLAGLVGGTVAWTNTSSTRPCTCSSTDARKRCTPPPRASVQVLALGRLPPRRPRPGRAEPVRGGAERRDDRLQARPAAPPRRRRVAAPGLDDRADRGAGARCARLLDQRLHLGVALAPAAARRHRHRAAHARSGSRSPTTASARGSPRPTRPSGSCSRTWASRLGPADRLSTGVERAARVRRSTSSSPASCSTPASSNKPIPFDTKKKIDSVAAPPARRRS